MVYRIISCDLQSLAAKNPTLPEATTRAIKARCATTLQFALFELVTQNNVEHRCEKGSL
jgi:hypothetical protein